MSDKTLVIIGTGPGIGRSVACLFAAKRYSRVGLIARRHESLETEKLALEKAVEGVVVKTYAVDVADRDALVGAMDKVRGGLGQPECIFYNAARVTQSKALDCALDEMNYDFKICCTSLAAITQSDLPQLLDIASSDPSARPALIVTSSMLPHKPDPSLFTLSLVKAAQRNQVLGLHEAFSSKGVHIGVVNVGGYVTETHETLNPTNIANKTWEWFEQSKNKASFEVQIL